MNFAIKLKELREIKNISQAKLAKDLNVSIGCVGMWESTKQTPPATKLIQIANYFDVSVDYLLGHNEITSEERKAGASETQKISITPIEDEMLYLFREIGKKHGEQAQQALITVAEKML